MRSIGKRRFLAGLLSILLMLTSIFAGNVVARAEGLPVDLTIANEESQEITATIDYANLKVQSGGILTITGPTEGAPICVRIHSSFVVEEGATVNVSNNVVLEFASNATASGVELYSEGDDLLSGEGGYVNNTEALMSFDWDGTKWKLHVDQGGGEGGSVGVGINPRDGFVEYKIGEDGYVLLPDNWALPEGIEEGTIVSIRLTEYPGWPENPVEGARYGSRAGSTPVAWIRRDAGDGSVEMTDAGDSDEKTWAFDYEYHPGEFIDAYWSDFDSFGFNSGNQFQVTVNPSGGCSVELSPVAEDGNRRHDDNFGDKYNYSAGTSVSIKFSPDENNVLEEFWIGDNRHQNNAMFESAENGFNVDADGSFTYTLTEADTKDGDRYSNVNISCMSRPNGGGEPGGSGGTNSYGKNNLLGFSISHPENGDVQFKINDGATYAVGGDDSCSEETIINALKDIEFSAGDTITVWARNHEGAHVSHFDIQIDRLGAFTNDSDRSAAKEAAESGDGYRLTVPDGYVSSKTIEFQIEFLTGGDGDGDGQSDNDVSISSDTTISSDAVKNDITVLSGTLTIDSCSVRIDHKLDVKTGGNIVGTSATSKLVFAGHAFSSGKALYHTSGDKLTGGPNETYENSGDGPVEFIWNAAQSRWETEQRPASGGEDHPWYTVSYGNSANLTTEHGQVYAERVHVGDTTYTMIDSEYNASDTDKIYSMEDTIFHQKTREEEADPTYEDSLTRFGIGGSDGDIFIRNDMSGVSIDFKFIPDFGYQLTNIYTNENEDDTLLNEFTAAAAVSSFTFDVIQGRNVHFEVKFEEVSNTTTGNAAVASLAQVESTNAATSGTLEMTINNGTANTANVPEGSTALVAYDISLANLVSKGGDRGNWSTPLVDLGGNAATVTIPVADSTNFTYSVIREHEGEAPVILEATLSSGTISFDTNKFSTYTIVKTPIVKSIETAEITLGDSLTYDGSAQTQTVASVVLEGTTLSADTDYEISGNEKTDAGSYTLTITGKGNYRGTVTKTFTIAKKTLTPGISGTVTKVYDNTKAIADASTLSIVLTGKCESDDVTATVAKYEYDAVAAGSRTVTATGITLSGAKAVNYELSATTASAACGTITKATPTITLSNLSETTAGTAGVKATLTPADSTAAVKIEYEVITTPAQAEKPCKYAAGHLASCATRADEPGECNCGYTESHTHDSGCGYAAAVTEVKDWTTVRPTAAGSYPVRATLPVGTTNLDAVTTPVTGTYTRTQYVAPSNSGDSSSDAPAAPATQTEEKKETPKPTTTVSSPKPSQTREEAKPEVKAPEVIKEAEKTTVTMGNDTEKNWEMVMEQLGGAEATPVVAIEMKEEKVVPSAIFEAIKGQDIEVAFEMDNGITWKINGKDITGADLSDINLAAATGNGTTEIPSDLISNITDGREGIELSLAFDGQFGFTATMNVEIKRESAGKYANLFYFNPQTQGLEFMCSAVIMEDGTADLTFTHASDYIIVVDEVPLSAEDNTSLDEAENENVDTGEVTEKSEASKAETGLIWFIVIAIVIIVAVTTGIAVLKKKENIK